MNAAAQPAAPTAAILAYGLHQDRTAARSEPAADVATREVWDESAKRWRSYKMVRNAATGLYEDVCEVAS
jgi:hypothetical protein